MQICIKIHTVKSCFKQSLLRFNTTMNTKILREEEVKTITKLSRITRWRLEKVGLFPSRIKIGINAIGWIESDIDDWIKSREKTNFKEAAK